MFPKRQLLTVAILVASSMGGLVAHSETVRPQSPAAEVAMEQVGKTFVFDYGELQIRVRYLSASKLQWEQIKGPAVGLKAEEEYGFSVVRAGLYFIWWQEEDTSVVTQVVDFEKRRVHTTWTSPDKKLAAFQGSISATE